MFAAVELFKIAAGRGDLQSWRQTTLAVLAAAAAVSSVLLDLVVHLRARRHRAALRLYFGRCFLSEIRVEKGFTSVNYCFFQLKEKIEMNFLDSFGLRAVQTRIVSTR